MKLLISIFALTFSMLASSQMLTFKTENKDVMQFTLVQVQSGQLKCKHGIVKSQMETIFNVFRHYEKTYQGYELFSLLDAVYSPIWRKKKKIIFRATDGYIQFADITEMIKAAENKKGLLAYAEKGMKKLSTFEKAGKSIDPNPYYIIWTHFSEKDKASHAHPFKWPYQLMSINLE